MAVTAPLSAAAQEQSLPVVSRQGFATIVGAGARANGMGGAFTAVADDATAASWNPAGLARLTNEVSVVYDVVDTDREVSSLLRYEIATPLGLQKIAYRTDAPNRSSASSRDIGFASATLRYADNVIELSARRLARFPSSLGETRVSARTEFAGVIRDTEIFERTVITNGGSIDDYALSVARTVLPPPSPDAGNGLRIGVSVGWMRGDVTDTVEIADASASAYASRNTFAHQFAGLHADVGFLYDLSRHLTVGGVYRSGFSTSFRYQSTSQITTNDVSGRPATSEESRAEGNSRMRWPHGFSVGVAGRPLPYLLLAADYSRTRWSQAGVDRIDLASFSAEGGQTVPSVVTQHDVGYPYLTTAPQNDTASLRFGADLTLDRPTVSWDLRLGWFVENQIVNAWGSLNRPEYVGYTAGIGMAFRDYVQFDIAYVMTRGDDSFRVEEPLTADSFAETATKSRRLIFSTVVRF